MTFIIALGIIIVLLCSASVFKLMQPKNKAPNVRKKKRAPAAAPGRHEYSATRHKKPKHAPVHETPAVSHKAPEGAPVMKAPELPVFDAQPVKPQVKIPDVISVNLYASDDKPYAGYELLQALLSCGMRFGAMNLFHRHEKKTGIGPVLFSLASCTKEGVFDLAKIGAFECKGLVLFMKPAQVDDPAAVYALLLETADQLINDLGGKVLNDKLQLLNKEDVIHTHQLLSYYSKDRKPMDIFE